MTDEINNSDSSVRLYLLGGLTPPQREQIERRVFTDPEYRERVELIEEELVDEFVDGGLPEEERGAFAAHLLANPNLRLDVGIVEELRRAARLIPAVEVEAGEAPAEPEPAPRPFANWLATLRRFRTPLVATCVLLLFISAGLLLWRDLEVRRLEQQLLYERLRGEKIEKELARLNTPGDEAAAAAALEAMALPTTHAELPPGVSRDARDRSAYPSLSPSPGAAYARLRLKLEPAAAGFQSYRARFKSVDDGVSFEVELRPTLEEGKPGLWVTLPLGMLPRGDYQVELSGRREADGSPEELADHYYSFRIAGGNVSSVSS